MNYENWLKLLTYELSLKNGWTVKKCIRRLEEINNLPEYHLANMDFDDIIKEINIIFSDNVQKKIKKEELKEEEFNLKITELKNHRLLLLKSSINTEDSDESLSFRMGVYIGEYICFHHLPVLSVSDMFTPNVIYVSEQEKRNSELLYEQYSNNVITWGDYRAYIKSLEFKYLPEILECEVPYFDNKELNVEDLIKGIEISLFNCDYSHYSTNNIKIEHTETISIIFLNKVK